MSKTIYLLRPLAATVASVALFAAALITGANPAAAQALFQPVTAADLSTAASSAAPANDKVVRDRLVRVDATALARHLAPAGADTASNREARAQRLDGIVRLDLFPDVSETFRRTAVQAAPDGGYVWEGDVSSKGVYEALLLVNKGAINGRVQLDSRIFEITHVTGNVHRITELDPRKFPPEAPPLEPKGDFSQAPDQPGDSAEDSKAAAKTIVKVLVVYTANAQAQAGGGNKIIQQINQSLALANQAYARAKVPLKLALAGLPQKIVYAESNDIAVDLNVLTNGVKFKAIRARRVSQKADVVSLFRRNDPAFCGIAWLPGSKPTATMPLPSAATKNTGYSVMNWTCVSNLSFHHEIGHNMGLRHDRFVDNSPGGFNFGYINKAKRQRTIMAYNNGCDGVVPGNFCTRINWFSSPTIKATGNVTIGIPSTDNSKRLLQTYKAISKYY